jgi:hypothetical protein
MTDTKRERDLRELFVRLREEDRERTPPFYAAVGGRAQQQRPRAGGTRCLIHKNEPTRPRLMGFCVLWL